VAYEIAQRLLVEGESLALLVLLDTTVHERYWPAAAWVEYLKRRVAHHFLRIRGLAWRELAPVCTKLTAALLYRLSRATGVAVAIDAEGPTLPDSLRRLREAGLTAIAGYRPRASALPITLIASDVNASNLCDPRLVWRKLTHALTIYDVPGSHVTMIHPPHLQVLAARLSRCVTIGAARCTGPGAAAKPTRVCAVESICDPGVHNAADAGGKT
jgi:thioesterase domain-containing protein